MIHHDTHWNLKAALLHACNAKELLGAGVVWHRQSCCFRELLQTGRRIFCAASG